MVEVEDVAQLAGHLAILCRESTRVQDAPELHCILEDYAEYLKRLQLRLQRVAGEVSMAFVGLSNVGKSTLLNALLNAEIAPRRNGPCTPLAIEYRYGESFHVRLFAREGGALLPPKTAEEMLGVLSQAMRNAKWFSKDTPPRVKVYVPSDILRAGAVLVDTPGFGSAGGPEGENHDGALQAFLKRSRSLVVWVINGQQGITATERHFHDVHLAHLCDNVVVTSCEDWPDADKARFSRKFGAELGRRYLQFHFVSGLAAMRARTAGNTDALTASGLPAFQASLMSAIDRDATARDAVASLENAADELMAAKQEFAAAKALWREDSWYRWRDLAISHPVKARLDAVLQKGRPT
jgi:GTP-binding protein EngB required for normal cell division